MPGLDSTREEEEIMFPIAHPLTLSSRLAAA